MQKTVNHKSLSHTEFCIGNHTTLRPIMILQKYRNLSFFFFYKNMYGRFAGRPKKDGRFNEMTVLPRWL